MHNELRHFYDFAGFRLEARERLLLRQGQPVELSPKVFETLLVLVRSSGRLVPKEELMRSVWPNTIVEEGNLTLAIPQPQESPGERDEQHEVHRNGSPARIPVRGRSRGALGTHGPKGPRSSGRRASIRSRAGRKGPHSKAKEMVAQVGHGDGGAACVRGSFSVSRPHRLGASGAVDGRAPFSESLQPILERRNHRGVDN